MHDDGHATVVVVEDDIVVNQALATLLETVGYWPRSYTSAEAFMDNEPPMPPCCAILDYQLPGMNGIVLQSRLERVVPYMPVLLLSGDVSEADVQRALRNGAYAFLRKPFDPDDLLARTEQALDVSESRR